MADVPPVPDFAPPDPPFELGNGEGMAASVQTFGVVPIVPDYSAGVWSPVPLPGGGYRQPNAWIPVWIDGSFAALKDTEGVTLRQRFHELFYDIGRVCSLAFYEYTPPESFRRFRYGSEVAIYNLSRQWDQYRDGGRQGSTYFAARAGGQDIYTGSRQKQRFGHGPLTPVNAVRIPGHALMTSLGWPEQGGPNCPAHAMRSPLMSAPIKYPTTPEGIRAHGLAGYDWLEIGWWQTWAQRYGGDGSPWLWRDAT